MKTYTFTYRLLTDNKERFVTVEGIDVMHAQDRALFTIEREHGLSQSEQRFDIEIIDCYQTGLSYTN